jgi:hypothetical protein
MTEPKQDLTPSEAAMLVRHFGYTWNLGPLEMTERDTPTGREWHLKQTFNLYPPERRITATIRING